MKLVTTTELLKDARKYHYAIGAFNVVNLEMLQAIVQAAEKESTPAIIQVWHGDLKHAGGSYISAIANVAAESTFIPIALQLDHGQNIEQVKTCIDWGFTSVMIDLSSSDFHDNINRTKEVVKLAHSKGVSVEAELGKIFSGQESVDKQKSALTDPYQAAQFVEETGVDALAVSVGTAHGTYLNGPLIDFNLLKKIVEKVQASIVIHGGSGTPNKDIIDMIKLGVTKINYGTELMQAYIKGLKEYLLKNESDVTVRGLMGYARDCVYNVVIDKIKVLNTLKTE